MIRYRFLKIISLKNKLGNRRLDMIVNLPVTCYYKQIEYYFLLSDFV